MSVIVLYYEVRSDDNEIEGGDERRLTKMTNRREEREGQGYRIYSLLSSWW